MEKKENVYAKRLAALRKEMGEKGIASYLILTGDPHHSEIPLPFFAAERKWFCPFSGDNATLLITNEDAFLWVDGRFFISAKRELEGTPITLMMMGEKGVKSLGELLSETRPYPLATDFSLLPFSSYKALNALEGARIVDQSFAYLVENAPKPASAPLFELPLELSGEGSQSKIARFKGQLGKAKAALITTLDDIAYLTNLRGSDIPYSPLFESFLYLGEDEDVLFASPSRVPSSFSSCRVLPLDELTPYLKRHAEVMTLLDPESCSASLALLLPNAVFASLPSKLMKAIKNDVEVNNTIKTQIKDGLAVFRFAVELAKALEKGDADEWTLSQKLHELREKGEGFIEESFETICSVGENAAMMHYAPSKESHSRITGEEPCLLLDSGGTYFGGTTDTTRTFPLNPSEEFKKDYTLTLKSLIAVSSAIFLQGAGSRCIDGLSRIHMWKQGLDYKCGTGHGVGYMSNVHEGPNSIRYKSNRDSDCPFAPGMITTVEPGVYKEGKYGIRIENNLLCVPYAETPDGAFYCFKTITYAPIATSCLDLSLLNEEEINWLNAYHQEVYEALSPLATEEELPLLKEMTKPI